MEVMIVVAIVAIIATIALPSYQDSVRKARRSDGIAALTQLQLEQANMRANCPFYADNLDGVEACSTTTATLTTINVAATSPDGHYTIYVGSASAVAYTATATAVGDQANDSAQGTSCDPLTLTVTAGNPDGDRGPGVCWQSQVAQFSGWPLAAS